MKLLFHIISRKKDNRSLTPCQGVVSVLTEPDQRSEEYHLPTDRYQDLMALLLDACPEEHREWVEDKLQYANKPVFRKQVKNLLDQMSEILLPLVGKSGKEKKRFTESVYYTRNYLVHHTKEDASKAAKGDELLFLTDCLSIALQACLLKELGFDVKKRVDVFQKHELYQFRLAMKR